MLRFFGLAFDLIIAGSGIITIVFTTKWANKKGYVGQNYCIALLAAIVYAMYAITSYDTNKLKCDCRPPYSEQYNKSSESPEPNTNER